MKIWAHRGCSQNYPENTLLAFEKAAELKNLAGIELDIQLTRDGYMVVFHDDRVDRTTDGIGEIGKYTLNELKKLKISAGNGKVEKIPTIEEVMDLLEEPLRNGLKLNIELKHGLVPYAGMEEKIVNLVHKRQLQKSVIYSSFCSVSLSIVRQLDQDAEIGILDTRVSNCLYMLKGGCGANVLHPYWQGIDLPVKQIQNYTVRAWFSGHLYPEKSTGTLLDMSKLEEKGITDVILNEPEVYIS